MAKPETPPAPIQIPKDIPERMKWCQICGKYTANPVDVLRLRQMLKEKHVPRWNKKPGQAHPGCMIDLARELGHLPWED